MSVFKGHHLQPLGRVQIYRFHLRFLSLFVALCWQEFINRHLGEAVYKKIIDPFVSGVYAGDPSELRYFTHFMYICVSVCIFMYIHYMYKGI